MKIINHKAIAALFAKVEELNQQSTEGWKCIYFKTPDAQDMQAYSLSRFDVNVVTHMLERMKGFVYLCDNGEIFILYRGASPSLISRLSMYLWSLSPQQHEGVASQPFSVFDLSGHWGNFYRFCEKRYMQALAISEESRMFSSESILAVPQELLFNDHVAGYLK